MHVYELRNKLYRFLFLFSFLLAFSFSFGQNIPTEKILEYDNVVNAVVRKVYDNVPLKESEAA